MSDKQEASQTDPSQTEVPKTDMAETGERTTEVDRPAEDHSQDLRYEHDPKGPLGQLFAPVAGYGVTGSSFFRPSVTEEYPFEPARVMPRYHGRHQLNRYEDGLEKCIGCELCAWACPADAILVEAASNTPEDHHSPGER